MSGILGILLAGKAAAAPSYTGPGDVVSGALAFWGLRAYSAAAIGGNAIRILRASDSAESDFVTLTGGGLDVASIATFLAATTGAIKTFYDQTGNGNHVTGSNFPSVPIGITLSGLGSLPIAVTPNNLHFGQYLSSTTAAQSQPFTIVGAIAFSTSGRQTLASGTTNRIIAGHVPGANDVEIYAGSGEIPLGGATDGTWIAYQGVFNGASSSINANGSQATGDPGSSSFAGNYDLGSNSANDALNVASFGEVGVWPSAFSGGNITAMNSNIRTYWAF